MQDTLQFPPSLSLSKLTLPRPRNLPFSALSSRTTISIPPKPPKIQPQRHETPSQPPPQIDAHDEFQEKMLFLDSIGIDIFSLISAHPPIVSASLPDIRATVDFMTSLGFNTLEFRRIVSMCPEVLSSSLADIIPVLTFLLREAAVKPSDLKWAIHRRPRLLACSVEHRLRPTLRFLQDIGLPELHRHTHLLSRSVEDKLIPKIDFFEKIGYSHGDSVAMFRRFPQLFNHSIKCCYEPKFNYFLVEMGRDLKELKEFPEYFSYSLEDRIKPRHQTCVEKGVFFALPVLLQTSHTEFRMRLEDLTGFRVVFARKEANKVAHELATNAQDWINLDFDCNALPGPISGLVFDDLA